MIFAKTDDQIYWASYFFHVSRVMNRCILHNWEHMPFLSSLKRKTTKISFDFVLHMILIWKLPVLSPWPGYEQLILLETVFHARHQSCLYKHRLLSVKEAKVSDHQLSSVWNDLSFLLLGSWKGKYILICFSVLRLGVTILFLFVQMANSGKFSLRKYPGVNLEQEFAFVSKT